MTLIELETLLNEVAASINPRDGATMRWLKLRAWVEESMADDGDIGSRLWRAAQRSGMLWQGWPTVDAMADEIVRLRAEIADCKCDNKRQGSCRGFKTQ